MSDLRELRNARAEPSDEDEVIAALVHSGPATAPALAKLPQFRDWTRNRMALALGSVWGSGKVTVDEADAFVALRTW